MSVVWQEAAGSCGLNVGKRVHAAFANSVALFAYESGFSKPGHRYFTCVISGHMSCGGRTLEEAQEQGINFAHMFSTKESDRRMTKEQFSSLVADPEIRKPFIPYN